MKKTIAGAAVAVALAASELIYPATAVVTDITAETATVTTSTGFEYQMPAEDYNEGDLVSLLMLDAGKWNRISDDTILSARFAGWTAEDIR